MTKQRPQVDLFRVRDDSSSISAVVRTVNAAFSTDPLIRWLRPNATPGAQADTPLVKWQYRRVQGVISRGMALRSASVGQVASQYTREKGKSQRSQDSTKTAMEAAAQAVVTEDLDVMSSQEDAGAVVFLFPPKGHLGWSFESLWLACKLWLLDLFSPANDQHAKKKRVDQLLAANRASKKALQGKYSARRLWYLELIAVHPSLQSRGLGGAIVSSIVEYVGVNPVYLECTRQENIGFYESFGFRVVEEMELVDDGGCQEDEQLKYWVMVRAVEG